MSATSTSASSSSSTLAIGHGPSVALWDYSASQTLTKFTPAHDLQDLSTSVDENLSDLQYSPNGQVVATSSFSSQHVILSHASTGAQLAQIVLPPTMTSSEAKSNNSAGATGVSSIHFGGGGRYMCLSSRCSSGRFDTNQIYIYNLAKMKWARSFSIDSEFQCTKVCFDPTSTFLASLSRKEDENGGGATGINAVTLWNIREGTVAASLHYPFIVTNTNMFSNSSRRMDRKGAMQFSSLVPHYCAVGCGSSVVLYDINRATGATSAASMVGSASTTKSNEPLFILRDKHQGSVTDVAFNPIARSLLASSSILDGCVKFHDFVTSKTIQTIYPPVPQSASSSLPIYADTPTSMNFHSSGVTFAIGTMLGNVYVYDLRKCDSPCASYSYTNGENCTANIDSHMNAIIAGWSMSNFPSTSHLLPNEVAPIPVSHVCFQQHSGNAVSLKKVRTPTKRPTSSGNSSQPLVSAQDTKNLSSLTVLNKSDGGVKSDVRPLKEENLTVTKGLRSDNATHNPVSETGTTAEATDTNDYKAPISSQTTPLNQSPVRETLESPLRASDKFCSRLSLPPSTSCFHWPSEKQKQDLHLNNVSPISAPRKDSSPSILPSVDASVLASPSRLLSKFDHIDESEKGIMKYIPLSPPSKSYIAANEHDKHNSQLMKPTRHRPSISDAGQSSFDVKKEQKELAKRAIAETHLSTDTRAFNSESRASENRLPAPLPSKASVLEVDSQEGRKSLLNSPDPSFGIARNMLDGFSSHRQSDVFETFLRTTRTNIDSDNVTVNKHVLRQVIEEVTLDLREELGHSIRNLHVDVIRQFQQQSDEITELFQKQKKVMITLIEENQKLRGENERLRSTY